MLAVLLTVHLIACISLVIAVLLQRSEGGALGMGGGGTGGIISGRGAANVLVRTTMGLALVFFITSVSMTRLNAEVAKAPTDLERQIQQQGADKFNPLAAPGTTPSNTTPPASTPAPAPAPIDPLAPVLTTPPASTTTPVTPPASTPAPSPTATKPPASSTPTQPAPAQPAPATSTPGGTPNQ